MKILKEKDNIPDITRNIWVHYVVTRNTATKLIDVYYDGTLMGSADITGFEGNLEVSRVIFGNMIINGDADGGSTYNN